MLHHPRTARRRAALALVVALLTGPWAAVAACAGETTVTPAPSPSPSATAGPAAPTTEPTTARPTTPEPTAEPVVQVSAGQCHAPGNGWSVARAWNEEILDAIRLDLPAPTVHARNLYHLSAAMWDVWAAFDQDATALFSPVRATATDVDAARIDAISFAAATILSDRYDESVQRRATRSELNGLMVELCGRRIGPAVRNVAPGSAAELGVRIARSVLEATIGDGSNEAGGYTDPTYEPVNPPMNVAAAGTEMVDPNRWQPLDLEVAFSQNELPVPDGPQTFIGSHWGHVTAFALPESDAGLPLDPGPPPLLGSPEFRDGVVEVIEASSRLQPGEATIDIGPGSRGDNTLGADDGDGHETNPVTGEPYAPNVVDRGDYVRVLAEFWADGPSSETPPGHWNTLANGVADALPAGELRFEGQGPPLDRLEWDVKLYVALNGALHDAAIAAWGAKAHYDYVRPISMIRYMGGLGQSSDRDLPQYDPHGLPLVPGLIELVTEENSAPGQPFETQANRIGEIYVFTWRGPPDDPTSQVSGVDWIRSDLWMPYQRPTFVTPAFAAYVSGHSTFSRAAAEILTAFTGSPFFPGGLGEHTMAAGELRHELGPTADVTLQWATYGDAADEAGRSRIYGGIHVPADDIAGRLLGAQCARLAFDRARSLY